MEKNDWLSFLSSRLKSQISLENFERFQTWLLAFVCIFSLGAAFKEISQTANRDFIFETKVLFIILVHTFALLGFYVPALLERGQKTAARILNLRNFSSLIMNAAGLIALAVIFSQVSHQIFSGLAARDAAGFVMFVSGANMVFYYAYLACGIFFFASLAFFPQALVAAAEKAGSRVQYVVAGTHLGLLILLGFSYAGVVEIGSASFFEQFRLAGLFLIALGGAAFLVGRFLKESAVPAIAALEFEVSSGRLERHEDILERYSEAFVSRKLFAWLARYRHSVASKSHDIASYTHEAVSLVDQRKPTETELRKVEDCYKKADQICRRLGRENNRFMVAATFFDVNEIERAEIEAIKDEFSRQLRNAKLELVSVRKRIDEKLVALKNDDKAVASIEAAEAAKQLPVNPLS